MSVIFLIIFGYADNSSALSTTFTLTLRKFVSLILSIIYFRNPFSLFHWIGTLFVFGGSVVYSLGRKKKVMGGAISSAESIKKEC